MRRSGNRMGNRGGAMNRGFSNDRSFGSGPSSSASVGPLMTDHLELHDLDLELELLKRKREILEQQQNMLLNDTRFTPQLGNGSQFNQNRNYSNFYNDVVAGTQFDHLDRQPSLKRAAPGVWNDGPAPKHYAGPSRSGQGPRKSGPFPKRNSRFDQKMGSGSGPSHAPGQRRPPPGNFKQNKVTKPNQGQGSAPNRLASYPANKVKGLLGSMVPPVRSAPKRPEEILFLRADEAPSPKLVGRLELALGQLLRELREEFGASRQHAEVFRSTTIQRLIKQNIRERIRDVMLNKQVGPFPEIVTLYRKKFPKHTDLELITNAQNTCEGRNSFVRDLIETANPEKYFKLNFEKLLNETLTNVFAQLEEVNKSKLKHKEARTKAGAEIMESIIVDLEADPDFAKIHVKEDKTDGADVNNTSEITDEKSAQQDNEINEQAANPDETSENGEKSAEVDEKSAEVAEKSAEVAEKSADVADNSDIAEKSADIAENSAENAENTSENTENIAKTEENLATESAEQASTETDNQEVKSNPIINKIIDDCFKSKAIVGEPLKAKFFTRLIENMLRRMIPTMLPRYKEQMIRIINSDEEFRKTKAYITMMANRKAENMANPQNGGATLVAEGQPPYFVRILGRPTLPHRKLMKVFLEQFHPTLIKKHKGSHNVLYVAFGDKEDVRNILEKSGDIVANMMLDIRVSEGISKRKSGWGPGPQLNSSNVQTAEPSLDNAGLDESLDNQITDLLTSIREEEEKKCDIAEQQVVKNETVKDENTEEVKNENVEQVDLKQDANENGKDTKNEAEEENQTAPEQEDNETTPAEDKETAEGEEVTEAVQKQVEAVKTEGTQGKGTPTRASSRLAATPSAIRTRRASKLGQN